jgi:hypothetical protein
MGSPRFRQVGEGVAEWSTVIVSPLLLATAPFLASLRVDVVSERSMMATNIPWPRPLLPPRLPITTYTRR